MLALAWKSCWNGFAVSVSQGVLCVCLTSSLAPDGVAVTSDPCHRGDSFCVTTLLVWAQKDKQELGRCSLSVRGSIHGCAGFLCQKSLPNSPWQSVCSCLFPPASFSLIEGSREVMLKLLSYRMKWVAARSYVDVVLVLSLMSLMVSQHSALRRIQKGIVYLHKIRQ